MYPAITPNIYATNTFHLVKNRMGIGHFRILLGVGICTVLTFSAYVIFYTIFDLKKIDLTIATSVISLILLNCTLFLSNKSTKKNRTLIIGHNDFRILENLKTVQVIPFEKVTITKLGQEINGTCRPFFIKINMVDFSDMIIREPKQLVFWEVFKNKISTSINHKTYFTKTKEEWMRLEQALVSFL